MGKREDKQKLIITTAKSCFEQFGYDKTTLDDIAGRLGMKKASLYYYYKNKEALFIAVLENETLQYLESLKDRLKKIADPKKKMIELMTFRVTYYTNVVAANNISKTSLYYLEDVLKEQLDQVEQEEVNILSGLLADMEELAGISKKKRDHLAHLIIQMATGIKHESFKRSEPGIGQVDLSKDIKNIIELTNYIIKGAKK